MTYLLVFTGLLVGALGVPIPEEVVLAVGGALAAEGRVSLPLVYLLGWGVVLLLDAVLHAVGARLGPRVEGSRLGRRVRPERWNQLRSFMERRGLLAVVLARFVMGARIPTFLMAGAVGMPRRRFLAAVGAAGLVSAAVPVGLGYALGARLPDVRAALAAARWGIFGLAVILVVVWWLRRRP